MRCSKRLGWNFTRDCSILKKIAGIGFKVNAYFRKFTRNLLFPPGRLLSSYCCTWPLSLLKHILSLWNLHVYSHFFAKFLKLMMGTLKTRYRECIT